ncbi:Hpt domain-containing protein [Vibrio intestinalis]|uniref:Hpt domain-containing protein n=1 Tax=Vibrio intestinalis TaxID=2933291 RepID=UPI0021A79B62|nr:Hpt domain-containing protein [Vibrio intestinalis]
MDKLQLKIGWVLVLVWMIGITVIVTNYRSTSVMMDKVEQLDSKIDALRSRLFFDAPYRIHFANEQKAELETIIQLKGELEQQQGNSWFEPDVQQLLFTTDRFIEHSLAFVANELALIDLIDQIQTSREQYTEQPQMALLYYQLSANVFEAMFSSQSSTSTAYRQLDALYAESVNLPEADKQRLQSVLAKTSLVMGGYAQGAFLVGKLIDHTVHDEVTSVEGQYHQLLKTHLMIGALFSGGLMIAVVLLWQSSQRRENSNEASEPHATSSTAVVPPVAAVSPAAVQLSEKTHTNTVPVIEEPEPAAPVEQPTSAEPPVNETEENSGSEIDFASMLDSLGDDRESMCMLLEVFIEDHGNDVEDIGRLLTDSPDEAMRKAHSLKGVGGNLGAMNLREAAGKIETAINQDVTQVPILLQELDLLLSKALQEAQQFLDEEQAA